VVGSGGIGFLLWEVEVGGVRLVVCGGGMRGEGYLSPLLSPYEVSNSTLFRLKDWGGAGEEVWRRE